MASGNLPTSAYDEFAKQDCLYLLDDVRFEALRFAQLSLMNQFNGLRTQSQKISDAIDYAGEWKKTCINHLNISVEGELNSPPPERSPKRNLTNSTSPRLTSLTRSPYKTAVTMVNNLLKLLPAARQE
ncbi:hypothetical protein QBC43DRAFT_360863 [Cladorrhinum sp. PSN259]|nr:hypothetical protein QBC43DRAFT_360863 [Cladorrhinum sp. PSN259]